MNCCGLELNKLKDTKKKKNRLKCQKCGRMMYDFGDKPIDIYDLLKR